MKQLIQNSGFWALVAIVGCIGLAIDVVSDLTVLEVLSGLLVAAALLMLFGLFVANLLRRRFLKALGVLGSLVGVLVVGFLTFIMIGVGQHHPPRSEDDDIVVDEYAVNLNCDTEDNKVLGTDLEQGSWWTDGMNYYQVKSVGQTICLEGFTLHEGGLEFQLAVNGDTLRVASVADGFTPFAREGCLVSHSLVTNDAGKQLELLVAYGDDYYEKPIAALERYDGKELDYELRAIHQALAGTYVNIKDSTQQWTLLADGTLLTTADGKPKPYAIELNYHMPADIIRMPDGSRLSVTVGTEEAKFYKARYDEDEEIWMGSDELAFTMRHQLDDLWFWNYLFIPSVATFYDEDMLRAKCDYLMPQTGTLALLNAFLIDELLRSNADAEAEEVADEE